MLGFPCGQQHVPHRVLVGLGSSPSSLAVVLQKKGRVVLGSGPPSQPLLFPVIQVCKVCFLNPWEIVTPLSIASYLVGPHCGLRETLLNT